MGTGDILFLAVLGAAAFAVVAALSRRPSARPEDGSARADGTTGPLGRFGWDPCGTGDDGFGALGSHCATDPAYSHVPGNVHYTGSALGEEEYRTAPVGDDGMDDLLRDDDWWADPAYCHLAGNIYHDSCKDDWWTDPAYCYVPGNIYYDLCHDDGISGSTGFDDDWGTGFGGGGSGFGGDW